MGLQKLLQGSKSGFSGGANGAESKAATRVWPVLLVLVYLVLPIYLVLFVAWSISRVLADLLAASTRSGQSLLDNGQPPASENSALALAPQSNEPALSKVVASTIPTQSS